jgi:hypothetical protein
VAGEIDPVRIVDDAIKDGIGVGDRRSARAICLHVLDDADAAHHPAKVRLKDQSSSAR